ELLIDADCNDQNIFNVVDKALRHYNNELKDGNQFVLYRITEARLKHENDLKVHNFVEYQIHEGSCDVGSGKVWQDCHFKESEPKVGRCSAHVVVYQDIKSTEVISQNCSDLEVEPPVTAEQYACLGCFIYLKNDNEELLPLIKAANEEMNKQSNHPFYFDLQKIVTAKRQVVSGWNYELNYQLGQTNCSKTIHSNMSLDECTLDTNGQTALCKTSIFVNQHHEIKGIRLQCYTENEFCLSCPNAVHKEDPELLDLLSQVIDDYNSDSTVNQTSLYKFVKVNDATKQEKMYTVSFDIQQTNCSKSDYNILGGECQLIQYS
ncbi:hypothetical protein GDO86_019291, partial [Hymenochirus boettgeri]